MNDHATQHSADFLAPLHQPSMIIANDIPTTKREVQPDLRFRSFPQPPQPDDSQTQRDTGASAKPQQRWRQRCAKIVDLIGQRVPFFVWEWEIHAARPSLPALLIPAFCDLPSAFYSESITRGKTIVAELGDALARLQLRLDAFETEDILAGPLLQHRSDEADLTHDAGDDHLLQRVDAPRRLLDLLANLLELDLRRGDLEDGAQHLFKVSSTLHGAHACGGGVMPALQQTATDLLHRDLGDLGPPHVTDIDVNQHFATVGHGRRLQRLAPLPRLGQRQHDVGLSAGLGQALPSR